MFEAARAALWASGAREQGLVIKTHSGLVAAFGESMVETGRMAPEQGRALARALKPGRWPTIPPKIPSLKTPGQRSRLPNNSCRPWRPFSAAYERSSYSPRNFSWWVR
jgi:hypothetical protein